MKKWVPILVLLVAGYLAWSGSRSGDPPGTLEPRGTADADRSYDSESSRSGEVAAAFAQKKSDVQVEGQGIVLRTLADDNEGSRHQRFILRFETGQTVLVAHNIDLAPRIPDLEKGDAVSFCGEYEWSDQGGVVHWTHRDPAGRHPGGWLKHEGQTYQ
ncbi:MAG: hypothetical protein DHS20C21_17340 [Gemmatimonadota bacterium]|nr:MAG: hypothetical protein DHS20C21_17340 [Gemmatimonadota bacterium]